MGNRSPKPNVTRSKSRKRRRIAATYVGVQVDESLNVNGLRVYRISRISFAKNAGELPEPSTEYQAGNGFRIPVTLFLVTSRSKYALRLALATVALTLLWIILLTTQLRSKAVRNG